LSVQASSVKRQFSQVEVHWFDDTGQGQCRVPESWRVQWRDGETRRDVDAAEYGTAKDRFNTTRFEPVTARRIRLLVKLQPEFSGGILEARLK